MELCYKQGDIYMCKVRCEYISRNIEKKFKTEFSKQCCCECGIKESCDYKCDMKQNHNRRMDK